MSKKSKLPKKGVVAETLGKAGKSVNAVFHGKWQEERKPIEIEMRMQKMYFKDILHPIVSHFCNKPFTKNSAFSAL